MIERSTLIRAGAGKVRVLRLMTDGAQFWPLAYQVAARDGGWCRRCGCTDRYGCAAPHCCWANATRTLCTRCADRLVAQ